MEYNSDNGNNKPPEHIHTVRLWSGNSIDNITASTDGINGNNGDDVASSNGNNKRSRAVVRTSNDNNKRSRTVVRSNSEALASPCVLRGLRRRYSERRRQPGHLC